MNENLLLTPEERKPYTTVKNDGGWGSQGVFCNIDGLLQAQLDKVFSAGYVQLNSDWSLPEIPEIKSDSYDGCYKHAYQIMLNAGFKKVKEEERRGK